MKKVKILFLFFLSISFLFAGRYRVKIVRVVDGDTVVVDSMETGQIRLRLLWIDTPEKYSSRKLDEDAERCGVSRHKMRQLGYKASAYAHRTFHAGDRVVIETQGKGYYGRTLALIWDKNGILYNMRVVADGYSCIYRKANYPFFLNVLLMEAAQEGKGLWGEYPAVMSCLCGIN